MHYDGTQKGVAVPLLDSVVGFEVDYFGEPAPPTLRHPERDRSVTYGPMPPPFDRMAGSSWPAGSNCTFAVVGADEDRRLFPRLEHLASPDGAPVRLAEAQLTDGPWCSDPDAPNRWDADLLRVRRMSVMLRVQAGPSRYRGTDPRLFRNPGTALAFGRSVPDREIRFDVALRNLGLAR